MATSFKQSITSQVDDFLASIAVSAEQIAHAANPERKVGSGSPSTPSPRVDRPYLVWKDDLELARRVNDFLSRER